MTKYTFITLVFSGGVLADCPPQLRDLMDMGYVTEDDVRYVTAHFESDTYLQFADYTVTNTHNWMQVEGTGDRYNYRDRNNRIRYRQRTRPPANKWPLIEDSEDGNPCWNGEHIVMLFSDVVPPDSNSPFEFSYGFELFWTADLNLDGSVDATDVGLLTADWGLTESRSDLNGDGEVGGEDLGLLFSMWTG